ncbi:MATE family efflux transporter [Bradyrhizobium sp. 183]|uniref:MATE family efflux transporter n=1 Tax=unclassified Bradyrhizobium TaxID=2631580 RepID=UPI001FFFE981|nr:MULTISPECIES: MATE family efflux transporter [unclassified Bradyrhizobium]UPJ79403.1 MATE family efflux transporter [Bradyrhizobium sp. 184]UPJ87199.1 MATE family efflux transporter [Bradyrhizobium sp. 183]
MDKITETRSISPSLRWLTRGAARHQMAAELSEAARLALPMVLAQLGQIAMMTTDLAFIGRISAEAIAAAALASRVYLAGITFGIGLFAAVTSLAAEAFGAHNLAAVRRSVGMGLWAALLLSLPITALSLRGEQILLAVGQAPDAARLAQQYLLGLAWGVAPALCFGVIRSFMGAVHRPEPIFWITLGAIPFNALLVYLLIYGKLGLPRLELFGAGLATTLVNFATLFAGLWFATVPRPFRYYHVLAGLWCFDCRLMQQLIVVGTQISITFLMDGAIWSAAAFLMGIISTSALAAHQIAYQLASILYLIFFGIGVPANVRVGHAVGRNDGPGIKRAGLAAFVLGIVIAAIVSLVVIAARFEIAEFFLADAADATISLATNLLLVGASCFITTAMYSIALGSLRGLKDTRVPLLFAAVGQWLIGLSLSYALGLKIGLGPIGIWIGLSIGTTVYAALLVVRFRLLASRLAIQNRCPATQMR